MVGPAAKRDAVTHLKAVMGLSERRACQIISADRKTIRYQSSRPPETELRAKLRELANERRRFGYRRLFVLLRREGEPSGVNRIYRLYREEGLSVRKREARRRAVGTRGIHSREPGRHRGEPRGNTVMRAQLAALQRRVVQLVDSELMVLRADVTAATL